MSEVALRLLGMFLVVLPGMVLVVLGYGLRVWGAQHLRQSGIADLAGTRIPPDGIYCTTGPYKYLKHPLYWGSLMVIAGIGVCVFGMSGLVLAIPAVPSFVERGFLETEARTLYGKEKGDS